MKITPFQFRVIKGEYPEITKPEEIMNLTDDQLLKCPNIGKMFIWRLRNEYPASLERHKRDIEIWNTAIDTSILALQRLRKNDTIFNS